MSKKLNHLAGRLVAVAALGLALGQAEAKTKPNVLFIFADDQCYETVANLGHTDIDTPNLDRLAAEGVLFTDAHSPCTICSPSRSISTRRWRHR